MTSRRRRTARSAALGCTVQDLLGHADVSTTMIYLHVMKNPAREPQAHWICR